MVNQGSLRVPILYTIAIGGIYIAGSFLPGSLNWGFHFLGFLPRWATLLYVLAIALACLYALKGNPDHLLERLGFSIDRHPLRCFFVSTFVFILCAFIFRIHIPILGDTRRAA